MDSRLGWEFSSLVLYHCHQGPFAESAFSVAKAFALCSRLDNLAVGVSVGVGVGLGQGLTLPWSHSCPCPCTHQSPTLPLPLTPPFLCPWPLLSLPCSLPWLRPWRLQARPSVEVSRCRAPPEPDACGVLHLDPLTLAHLCGT